MKKFLFFILAILPVLAVAQTKQTVYVDNFTADRAYSDSDVRSLRSNVIRAIAKTGRVNVVDGTTNNTPEGKYTTVTGYLQQPTISQQSGVDRGERFTLTDVRLNYIVTMTAPDMEEVSFLFTTTGTSSSGEANALSDACRLAHLSMNKMIETVFPVKGVVLMVDEKSGDKAKTIYISLGSENGIKKGQKFDVTVMRDVAGDKVVKTIGTVTAKEVGNTKTLCSVNAGEEVILNNITSGIEMTVNTREKKGFLKGIGNAMGGIYGGGLTADSGERIDTRNASGITKSTGTQQQINNTVATASSSRSKYFDFLTSEDGFKYMVPFTDWNGKKADIIAYMKNSGYNQENDEMLTYNRHNMDDEHDPSIIYMILNGQFYTATAVLFHVKKDDVLAWMKSNYVFKGVNNQGLSDMHTFQTKDRKTSVNVSFTNVNESEFSIVTIMYRKAM